MKTNATVTITAMNNKGDIAKIAHPVFRPTGCYFVVSDFELENEFSVTDPTLGVNIAKCNSVTTATKFANMLHTLLLKAGLLTSYADATDAETKTKLLVDAGLKSFWALRLCRPGQFDAVYAEQVARNEQLSKELVKS